MRFHAFAILLALSECHGFGTSSSRRTFLLSQSTAVASLLLLTLPKPAHAIPMVTISEFRTILRDNSRSLARVEFSGPRQETVLVVLQDGTTFGISDVVDSPVDPRSPLQVQAMCRENEVPVKFTDLEALLQGKGRGKLYTNERVQQANLKEEEKKARMAQDEVDRQAALQRME